jgi:tetratricopeptide (TPR) repeat protein
MSEQTLDRLIRVGLKALVVGIALAAIIYFLERRDTTPSLVERQIAAAEAAVREQPAETGLRLRLADMYRAAKRPDDALEQYDAVLEVEAGQSTALLGRGEVLAESGSLSGAKQSFEKVIGRTKGAEFATVDPQLEAAYYGLGSVMLKQHRAKGAMRAAKKAVDIEPTDADALYLLGTAAVKAGTYGQAVKALRQAVLFVPTEWCEPYEGLSKAYSAQHRKPYAEYASAMVELCEEDPAGASQRLKRLASGPVAVDAMLGLGMAAEAQSHRASAARWYRKVLAADPESFNARGGLARLGVIGPASTAASPPAGHAAAGAG